MVSVRKIAPANPSSNQAIVTAIAEKHAVPASTDVSITPHGADASRPRRLRLSSEAFPTLLEYAGKAGRWSRSVAQVLLGASGLRHLLPSAEAPTGAAAKVAEALHEMLHSLVVDDERIFSLLEDRPAAEVSAIARAYDARYDGVIGGESLREAINVAFRAGKASRALRALDTKIAQALRPDGPPLHDLAADPSGLHGPSGDGRLPQTIDKILALRRGREVAETDLVNHHEVTGNNRIQLLVNGTEAFPQILDAIDNAKDSIHISYYIFNGDQLGKVFADKLLEKVSEGVKVRMTVDALGSTQFLGSPARKILDRLEAGGVEIIRNHLLDPTRPSQLLNHPDHRKIVLVDGKIAFTGGMNVGTHYISEYHDLMVRVEGDAVRQIQAEWILNWLHLDGQLDPQATDQQIRDRYFPSSSTPPGSQRIKVAQMIPGEEPEILATYLQLIREAKTSIHIENPYMTSPVVQDALIDAAKRGVEVHVILPSENDHGFSHLAARAKYPAMLEAGVKIYEYPGFNHGKVMVVDGERATIGSSNLDDVALYHIYEMNVNVDDAAFARACLEGIFEKDIAVSRPMTLESISTWDRVAGRFFGLFSHVI